MKALVEVLACVCDETGLVPGAEVWGVSLDCRGVLVIR